MHKITNLWKFELSWWSKLRDNNERKNTLVTRSSVLADAWFRDVKFLIKIVENYFFLENFVTSEGAVSHHVLYCQPLLFTRYQVRFYANNYFEYLPTVSTAFKRTDYNILKTKFFALVMMWKFSENTTVKLDSTLDKKFFKHTVGLTINQKYFKGSFQPMPSLYHEVTRTLWLNLIFLCFQPYQFCATVVLIHSVNDSWGEHSSSQNSSIIVVILRELSVLSTYQVKLCNVSCQVV